MDGGRHVAGVARCRRLLDRERARSRDAGGARIQARGHRPPDTTIRVLVWHGSNAHSHPLKHHRPCLQPYALKKNPFSSVLPSSGGCKGIAAGAFSLVAAARAAAFTAVALGPLDALVALAPRSRACIVVGVARCVRVRPLARGAKG
eukprot:scaffold4995_cov117-Isochrysis_galbana.AAC.1